MKARKRAPDADNEDFLKALKAESLEDLKKKVKDDLASRKEREKSIQKEIR